MSEALQLVPYALLAALSPVGLTATLTVMKTGRVKAAFFAIAFVAGQLLACSAVVALGAVTVPDRATGHDTALAVLGIAAGVALLALAVRVHRGRENPVATRTGDARSQRILERLSRVHVLTAIVAGLLLGIGGPKRLTLTILAAGSIASSDTGTTQATELILWYSFLATVLVWAPVLVFVLLGDRAVSRLDAGLAWFRRHQRVATFYALVVVGVWLVAEGIAQL